MGYSYCRTTSEKIKIFKFQSHNTQKMANLMIFLSLAAIACSNLVLAHEPSPLQDFCVADLKNSGKFISKKS